jgi:hypothetical protein
MAVDVCLLQFMADMKAQPSGGGGAVGDVGESIGSQDPQFSNQSNPKNFDSAKYEAERHAVSMKVISDRMTAARKVGQKFETVSDGWNPQRDFLRNGRDPHASWKKRR